MLGYTGKSRELRRPLSTERIEQKTEYKAEHKNRQQVLVLYLASSALDSPVKGWSYYDGWSDDPVGIGHESNHPTALVLKRARWLEADSGEPFDRSRRRIGVSNGLLEVRILL